MTQQEPSLLHLAGHMERQQTAHRDDLRVMLFPKSDRPPSERDIANMRQCLAGWVRNIEGFLRFAAENEAAILPQKQNDPVLFAECWPILSASGLLSDEPLLEQAICQMLYKKYARSLSGESNMDKPLAWLGQSTGHADSLYADAAMRLSAAYLRLSRLPLGQSEDLPVEVLNLLAWRIVAAHEVIEKGRQNQFAPHVRSLLARHDEGASLLRASGEMAHKMIELAIVDPLKPELRPEEHGLPLTLALLGLASGMPTERLVEMAHETGRPRMLIILRAMGYDERSVGIFLNWLTSQDSGNIQLLPYIELYRKLPVGVAENTLQRWRNDAVRTHIEGGI